MSSTFIVSQSYSIWCYLAPQVWIDQQLPSIKDLPQIQ